MLIGRVFEWFSGGHPGYMPLLHCMNHDRLWVAITLLLDFSVAGGYILIAKHWWVNERDLAEGAPKQALRNLKNIFVFCGICGYLFIPIKMVWPAWRLYDMFLAVLSYYTWRFAWNAGDLKVVYKELGRSAQLAEDLEASRAESRGKSYFLNAVSHDLRTPLNGLVLHTELVEMSLQSDDRESLRESLAEIKAGALVTANLLDHFLELGRIDWSQDEVKIQQFAASEAISALHALFQVDADRRGLALNLVASTDLAIRTDRSKLDRILMNLVANGLKFTTSGGVTVVAQAQGADLSVIVEDTGQGIPPEHQARIFDEFYQVENEERDRRKGFGLGLAIARRLANLLGGNLSLESVLGRGSRFTLKLPGVVVDEDRDRPRPLRGERPLSV